MKPGNDELIPQLSKLSRKEMMKSSLLQNQGIINRFLWPEFHCHMLLWIQNIFFSVLNLIRSPAIYFPDLNLDQNACRSIKSCPFPWLYFFRQLRILIENYFTSCKLWTLKVSKKFTSSPMMGVPSSKKPTKFCLFLWPLIMYCQGTHSPLIYPTELWSEFSSCSLWGISEQNFDLYIFFSAQGRSTWSDDISLLSRIGILIGKADYYFQDLPLTTRLSHLRVIKIKR